jgi:hypothetical protein
MLRKSCAVLFCAIALALPARAVEIVPTATSTPAAKAAVDSSSKLHVSRKSGKHNANKHQRKLAASGSVKTRRVGATKKPGQIAGRTTSSSKPAKLSQVKPKKTKSAAPRSQHAKHRTAPQYTGSVAPRSVPTPGLY